MKELSTDSVWWPACYFSSKKEETLKLPLGICWRDHVCRNELWTGAGQIHMSWWYFFFELAWWYCRWKSTACDTFMVHLLWMWFMSIVPSLKYTTWCIKVLATLTGWVKSRWSSSSVTGRYRWMGCNKKSSGCITVDVPSTSREERNSYGSANLCQWIWRHRECRCQTWR